MTRPDVAGLGMSRHKATPWEPWRFAVLIGFLSVICLNPATLNADVTAEVLADGSLLTQILWLMLLLLSLLTMQDGWPGVRFQLTPSLFIALCWMLLTVWPSLAPDISIRRYIFTAIAIAVTILCIGAPRDDNTFVKAFLIVALFEIALKYAFVFAMPSIGIHDANGTSPQLAGLWRGHHSQKNLAAAICVMEIFVLIAMRKRIPFLYLLIPLALNTIFLFFAGSKTSIGLVFITLGLAWIVSRSRGIFTIALIVGGVLLALNMVTVLSIYNTTMQEIAREAVDDITFTGRTDLWRFLIDYISMYPWTGSGFQSFWLIGPASPALQDGRSWLSSTPYGHQGYLDLAASTGIIGLVLACLFAIVRPIADTARVRSRHDPVFEIYLTFWIFGLLHNVTETSLFDRASPVWIFTLIGICGIRRAVWRENQGSESSAVRPSTSPRAVNARGAVATLEARR